jgi:probable F420-dependent oxidoreductase
MPLQLGVVFPQRDIGADAAGIRAFAQAAEELGFRHVLAYDHVLGADPRVHGPLSGPYTHETSFHEPFLTFAHMAAVAPSLEFATAVLVLPQRQTALVAKQAAEVDVLTGGRLRLGVGIGWNHVEYEALGVPFKDRGRLLEEQIGLLRALWTQPVVDFTGRYHRVRAAGVNPLPVQRPIPVWVGGAAAPAIARAARLADGWFTPGSPADVVDDRLRAALDAVRRAVDEAGRDPAQFGVNLRLGIADGSPRDWARQVEAARALGVSHVTLNALWGGLVGARAHIARLAEAADAVFG